MLPILLLFTGALLIAMLVSATFLAAFAVYIESQIARLLWANACALVTCELLYRALDFRFYFVSGAIIYAAAQVACFAVQYMFIVKDIASLRSPINDETQL